MSVFGYLFVGMFIWFCWFESILGLDVGSVYANLGLDVGLVCLNLKI